MKPINPTEEQLLRIQADPRHSSAEAKIFWIKEMAYPDPRNDYAAGSSCAVCPPPHARHSFVNKLIAEIKGYCVHHDSAIQVAEYIVSEIKQNTKSENAAHIRKLLSSNSLEEQMDLPWYAQGQSSSEVMMAESILALGAWAKLVQDKGVWDHKPIIRDQLFNGKGIPRPAGYTGVGNLSLSHYFKYKDYDYFLDVWSNIHFGYVGKSVGIGEDILLFGSNAQQVWNDIKQGKLSSGDTGSDKASIMIGIDLYSQFGKYANHLTAHDLLDALDASTKFIIDDASKQTHWCWHKRNPEPKKKRK